MENPYLTLQNFGEKIEQNLNKFIETIREERKNAVRKSNAVIRPENWQHKEKHENVSHIKQKYYVFQGRVAIKLLYPVFGFIEIFWNKDNDKKTYNNPFGGLKWSKTRHG